MVSECVSFDGPADVSRALALLDGDARHGPRPWPEMVDDGVDKMLAGLLSLEEAQGEFGQALVDRCVARGVDPSGHALALMARRT